MRKGNGLAAILVGGDLGDDLGRNVAGGREAVRLFDERAGDDRAVLEHVFQIHKVAVVHVLGKIVRVVEVDDTGLVRLDDLLRQQHPAREVFGYLARHIVALDSVDGGVLVGVFLLDLFVVRLDEGQDLVVRRVRLAHQRARVAVGDVVFCDLICPVRHDLVLNEVLNLFDTERSVHRLTAELHALGDAADLHRGQPVGFFHDIIGSCDGGDDLHDIEDGLRAVALDNLHTAPSFQSCYDRRCAGKYEGCISPCTHEHNILWLLPGRATKYAPAGSAIDNILDHTWLVKSKNWFWNKILCSKNETRPWNTTSSVPRPQQAGAKSRSALPLVFHFFRKSEEIAHRKHTSIVQNGCSGELSEDLVLVGF